MLTLTVSQLRTHCFNLYLYGYGETERRRRDVEGGERRDRESQWLRRQLWCQVWSVTWPLEHGKHGKLNIIIIFSTILMTTLSSRWIFWALSDSHRSIWGKHLEKWSETKADFRSPSNIEFLISTGGMLTGRPSLLEVESSVRAVFCLLQSSGAQFFNRW